MLALVQSTGLEGYALILAILLVFLILGCVMDSMAIILIFVPLFAPIVVSQGFDLVWFGIIVTVVTEIALITPPVGMNVFVLKAVLPDVPVLRIFRGLFRLSRWIWCVWRFLWPFRPLRYGLAQRSGKGSERSSLLLLPSVRAGLWQKPQSG